MEGNDAAWIRMDDKIRNDLGVVTGQTYYFRIETC